MLKVIINGATLTLAENTVNVYDEGGKHLERTQFNSFDQAMDYLLEIISIAEGIK